MIRDPLRNNRIPLLLFLLMACAYVLTAKGTLDMADSEFSYRTALALVEKGSLSIDPSARIAPSLIRGVDGKLYSKYGIGLPFLWVPLVALGKMFSSLTGMPLDYICQFLISFYNVGFGAGLCVLVYALCRHFGATERASLATSLSLGLGSLAWRYSLWTFSEITQGFFLVLGIYLMLRFGRQALLPASAALGALILLKAANAVFIPIFLIYVGLLQTKSLRSVLGRLVIFCLPLAVATGVLLAANYVRFGGCFETGYGGEMGGFHLERLGGNLLRLLASPETGLLIYSPVVVLGMAGYPGFLRAFRREALLFLSIIGINLAVYGSWYAYWGGFSWGPRYQVPVLSLILLPAYRVFRKKGLVQVMALALIIVSFLIQTVGVLENSSEYQYIRQAMVGPEISEQMPSTLVGSTIILLHKLRGEGNRYSLSEFGVDSQEAVDTSAYETYQGINLWYMHLARFLNKPRLGLLGLPLLPILVILTLRLRQEVQRAWNLS